MPGSSDRVQIYRELVEFILAQHREMLGLDRLNLFLTKARRKYPMLDKVQVNADYQLEMDEEVLEDEETALKNMSIVVACAYKVLEMFVGSSSAKERVTDSVDSFRSSHPELDETDLDRYVPKKEGEEEDGRLPEDVSADDILELKEEGIPFYDEKKKEWVLKPAHIVKKVKEEVDSTIEPVFEDEALKKKKMVKRKMMKKVRTTPKEKKAKGTTDTYQWLQEDLEVGTSLYVEGTGQEKNMLCAEFLKEGLEAGEEVIAILGYSPKLFMSQLQKLGIMEKDLSKLHIIDWHTFKERHVMEVKSEGNIHTVPKDPKHMGSVLTKVLAGIGKEKRKRAFVSIVSYALAFIDFETVYNFAQITWLKFKRGGVSGLFTIEAGQHGKEIRDSFKEIADGWIRIREGLSGANTWKMKADILPFSTNRKVTKDVVIMRNGIVVLERKVGTEETIGKEAVDTGIDIEEVTPKDEEGVETRGETIIDPYLKDKMEMWKGLGFSVEDLEVAIEKGEDEFKEVFKEFEKKADRALEIRGKLDDVATKLKRLRVTAHDEEILGLRKMLKLLRDLDEVEDKVVSLEQRMRKKQEKEGRRRDREKEIFRIRMEHWTRQGYDTGRLAKIIDLDLETVNKEFATFRSIVNRLRHIEEELNDMDVKGHRVVVETIKDRLFDVDGIEEIEKMYTGLKERLMVKERLKETVKSRRNELLDEVFNWALEGYCVDLIDNIDIFNEDLSSLEDRLGQFRNRIHRLKEMEKALNGLDLVHHRGEERQIRALLKDVDMVVEVEKKVLTLQQRVKGDLSGDVMALDENIERVKDLEDTWQKLKARLLAESKASEKVANDKESDD